jgi:hypothetical protein
MAHMLNQQIKRDSGKLMALISIMILLSIIFDDNPLGAIILAVLLLLPAYALYMIREEEKCDI